MSPYMATLIALYKSKIGSPRIILMLSNNLSYITFILLTLNSIFKNLSLFASLLLISSLLLKLFMSLTPLSSFLDKLILLIDLTNISLKLNMYDNFFLTIFYSSFSIMFSLISLTLLLLSQIIPTTFLTLNLVKFFNYKLTLIFLPFDNFSSV